MGTCEKKRERILMMLKQYHRLSVSDVVNALNASEATVRRYFKDMEKSGQLIRVCGGARNRVSFQAQIGNTHGGKTVDRACRRATGGKP